MAKIRGSDHIEKEIVMAEQHTFDSSDERRREEEAEAAGPQYEEKNVHEVYEAIAEHFSRTRYKPWPIVERFLLSQPPGSIGLDIGCGNGKYLSVVGRQQGVFIIGSDRSPSLTTIASTSHQEHDAIVADTLSLPHPAASFDFAICIAVIHHFSTRERRVAAVGEVLGVLLRKPGGTEGELERGAGRALIYVWALEQKNSRRGWDEGGEQDVMVPWVLTTPKPAQSRKEKKKPRQQHGNRGVEDKSMEMTNEDVDATVVDASSQIVNPPDASADTEKPKEAEKNTPQTYLRYYHLYRQGELEEDVVTAGGKVVESGYEKDNWWAIIEPGV
ncbi:S-adenosyl-L-methionine-dependent methyltransferase [Sporormia fimetaria CBS 119925]|uniref:S-adenosyl-L-methionine-dependent methyltransferase n=1 Tax=Sporormia fimetaria CBS 119925 TaxID=1340428 RepID=A0A6A6UXM5_9PLEO|nr:S-adenosyl-L-methionine-dependent methyltransferase [Sporormia fimetaria CBS 119925]